MAPTRRLYLIYKLPALSPHLPLFFPRLAQQVLVHSICRSWHESWNLIISGGLEGKKKKNPGKEQSSDRCLSAPLCNQRFGSRQRPHTFYCQRRNSRYKRCRYSFYARATKKRHASPITPFLSCVYSLSTAPPSSYQVTQMPENTHCRLFRC